MSKVINFVGMLVRWRRGQCIAPPSQLSEESGDEDSDGRSSKQKSYVPPRVVAVPYEEDDGIGGRQRRMEDRLKRMALRSELVKELRDEYLDTPLEVQVS